MRAPLSTWKWLLLLGLTGCTQQELCTAEAVAGVQVTLKDSLSMAPVCDATVTLTAPGYQETMMAQPGTTCSYRGAYERRGTYEVNVTDPHHHPARKQDVT